MKKTTLTIDEHVMAQLKEEAVRQGTTMSELVETALRRQLQESKEPRALSPLPTFAGGRELVDIADRDALYRTLDET